MLRALPAIWLARRLSCMGVSSMLRALPLLAWQGGPNNRALTCWAVAEFA